MGRDSRFGAIYLKALKQGKFFSQPRLVRYRDRVQQMTILDPRGAGFVVRP